ncbi:MAG: TIGR04076 family protein, partial [Phycisphaerales bacterium]
MDIVITVKEIRGHCPTYRVGTSFTLKAGYQLVSDVPVCMHALASLMPYYNALRVSEPAQW